MNRPNFFIVGAPRCGTTSMWHYLSQHPEIYMPEYKEPHFFGSDLLIQNSILQKNLNLFDKQFIRFPQSYIESEAKEISNNFSNPSIKKYNKDKFEQYLSIFAKADKAKCIGEASTWYLYSNKAATEIKEFNPNAKIIIMLRNPLDMMLSLHTLYVSLGAESYTDFADAIKASDSRKKEALLSDEETVISNFTYIESAKYAIQVERYQNLFGKENIHYIIYDDLKINIERVYNDALNFLDVSLSFKPEFIVVDPSEHARFKFLHSLEVKYGRNIRHLLSSKFYSINKLIFQSLAYLKRLNQQTGQVSEIDSNMKFQLQKEFQSDISHLSELLNRDLTYWLKD